MFIPLIQTNVNNVCCYESQDVLLLNTQNSMMHVAEEKREEDKGSKKREYPNEKTFDQ
jgi:hypothetical protein